METKAKKSLGQNFLINNSVLKKMIGVIAPKAGETIVEIGPGHGELTLPLINSGAKVIAIEKDTRLTIDLKQLIIDHKNLKLIQGDALKILPSIVSRFNVNSQMLNVASWKLAGNIPYYITGFLLRIIGELEHKPSSIVLTIQKEVAERICAKPPRMNLLAASVQFWGRPEIVATIPRESFNPIPKVDSAIIKLSVKATSLKHNELINYYNFLHILFKQPRKTIWNNLKTGQGSKKIKEGLNIQTILKDLKIDGRDRPQDLSVANLIKLSAKIYS